MARASPIPSGMHTITPNLVVRDCAKAIEFYKEAFGAQELLRMPAPDGQHIWHAELKIGDSVLYLNDEMPRSPTRAPSPHAPATASIQLYVVDADAVYQRALDAGATMAMPIGDMFWGDRAGMVVDPFGYPWFISTHVKDMTLEEIRRAGEEAARRAAMQEPAAV